MEKKQSYYYKNKKRKTRADDLAQHNTDTEFSLNTTVHKLKTPREARERV